MFQEVLNISVLDYNEESRLAIHIYNNIRPHWGLNLQIPNLAHQKVSTNFRTEQALGRSDGG